jgi:hypothetical protein
VAATDRFAVARQSAGTGWVVGTINTAICASGRRKWT